MKTQKLKYKKYEKPICQLTLDIYNSTNKEKSKNKVTSKLILEVMHDSKNKKLVERIMWCYEVYLDSNEEDINSLNELFACLLQLIKIAEDKIC